MPAPSHAHRVQLLAYQIWEQEGRPEGRHLEHWQQAEKQLEVEFRVGFPDATGDEDPDSYLSSSDSDRAARDRSRAPQRGSTRSTSTR
jgi:hypothetical protein